MIDQVGGHVGKYIDGKNNLDLQNLKGRNLLDLQNLIGEQKKDVTGMEIAGNKDLQKNQLDNQDKWINAGRDSFTKAGLPEFSFWDRGRGGPLNVGSTRSSIGGNNFVNSFGGPNTNLPSTGSSPYADLNGLSRPF